MKLLFCYTAVAALALTTSLSCAPTAKAPATKVEPMLLGVHPRADLKQPPYRHWFDSGYAAYQPKRALLPQLTSALAGCTFRIFMGTWCGDSRREVPRMLKILDSCGVSPSRIQIIMVDYRGAAYKQSPGHEERGQGIVHVPDLIVLSNGREVGRIVESPVTSLEEDLIRITGGQAYVPQYGGAWWLLKQFQVPAESALKDSLRGKVKDAYELLTLGYTLRLAGDTDRALLCFRLDTALYPGNPQALEFLSGKR